jgi:photosystem II stability/assembly factor-like uncharacterized protein
LKKLIIALPLLFLSIHLMYASDGPNFWTISYNNNGRVYAMVINPVSQNIMYEAGLDSGVYKSTDFGVNWSPANNGLTYNHVQAMDISRSNPDVLYVGTDQNGAANSGVYKTTDAGATWTFVTTGITDTKAIQSITIHPMNPSIVWCAVFDGANPAVDGVYKTTNGGTSWFVSSTGITNKNILTVIANPLNGNSLFAGSSLILPGSTGPSTMYKSYDGGANWFLSTTGLPTNAVTGDPIRAMSFSTIDTSVVLAGLFLNDTAGGSYLTTNGGALWVKKHNGLPNVVGTLPRAILIRPGTTNQFFVGLDGGGVNSRGVWRTVDGGNNWVDFNNGDLYNTFTIRGLVFRTQGDSTVYTGAATAAPVTARGVYQYSWPLVGSCAYVWSAQTSGTTNLLYSVKAVSNNVGWAVGATATVRRTTDGGSTWGNGNPNPGVINGTIYAIEAIDANTAWCTTSPAATFIYRTTNGGVNWTQVFTQTGGFIDDIKFNNANTGFAYGDPVGSRWSLWKTTNGGVTWDSTGLNLIQAGAEAGWNNAMILMGNNIWFGTNNTRVYKSTNFGTSWTFGATTGELNSYSVHINSLALGLIGGTTLQRTTDGGATYTSLGNPLGTGNITALEGVITDFWYTRGTGIYRSTNSGSNWVLSFTAAGALNDIDFAIVNGCPEGWAVGAAGTIVKMANLVGIGNNNNEIPNVYKLEQNFPNPFNPSTQITFALPKAGIVKLIVYDILGREVRTILNEFVPAGNHSVEFDAGSLASGAYFYKIESGDFTDTKKMVLLK